MTETVSEFLQAERERRRRPFIIAAIALFIVAGTAVVDAALVAARPDLGNLATQLCDPDSMQVRAVVQSETAITGQVNARTPAGGYAGFRGFAVERSSGTATIASTNWGAECTYTWTEDRRDLFIPDGLPIRP